jgi:hypothetical protein
MTDRLGRYRDKRDPSTTSEPGVTAARGPKPASTKNRKHPRLVIHLTVEQVAEERSGDSK